MWWLCLVFSFNLPYAAQGLSDEDAARHVLNRLAFGPTPGQVEAVVAEGVEVWVARQLQGLTSDAALDARLAKLPALDMDVIELVETYPGPGRLMRRAVSDGVIEADDARDAAAKAAKDERGDHDMRRKLMAYAMEEGVSRPRDLDRQLITQALWRARYGENQLREVMTAFWFNHFTVSRANNRVRPLVLAYERDAIRPNALGDFRTLLGAVAKHPAMLVYLDNVASTAEPGVRTTIEKAIDEHGGMRGRAARKRMNREMSANRPRGINENYARELLELHTLGVDGGYTQDDVIAAARILTGWSVMPAGESGERIAKRLDRGKAFGFHREGGFLFRPGVHDAEAKRFLSHNFSAGGGYEEGERLLDILASHPATARFIALKLARRFIADTPDEQSVEAIAATFRNTKGDILATMTTLIQLPAFWRSAPKYRNPFELAVAGVRAVNGQIDAPRGLHNWIERMGMPLYASPGPDGFPDRADAWKNTGLLMHRINFAADLTADKIPGVRVKDDQAIAQVALLFDEPSRKTSFVAVEQALDGEKADARTAAGLLLASKAFQYR